MKIYFIRNTHDETGNYRGDSYFGKVDMNKEYEKSPTQATLDLARSFNQQLTDQELPFGVHTWS